MRILFLVNELAMGGLEKVIVTICNELSASENVTLYSLKKDSFGYKYHDKLNIQFGTSIYTNAIKYPLETLKVIKKKKLFLKKKLNFKIIKNNINFMYFDAVVLSEADILYSNFIRSINSDIKIIGWIHSTFESYKDRYMKDSYTEFIESLKSIDTLIVLTDKDKEAFSKIHINVIKISNPNTFNVNQNKLKEEKKEKIISFVGRLDYKVKGLDYLIQVGKNIPEGWKISIAGEGRDSKKFIQEISDNKLQKKFILNGKLKEKELIEHYKKSTIFILTSRWEGFGLVIIEAMSMGLPIISFASSGPNEIIGKNNEFGIIIKNGDTKAMSKSINKMIYDKKLQRYYEIQSLKRAKDYDVKSIRSKWLRIFRKGE